MKRGRAELKRSHAVRKIRERGRKMRKIGERRETENAEIGRKDRMGLER